MDWKFNVELYIQCLERELFLISLLEHFLSIFGFTVSCSNDFHNLIEIV